MSKDKIVIRNEIDIAELRKDFYNSALYKILIAPTLKVLEMVTRQYQKNKTAAYTAKTADLTQQNNPFIQEGREPHEGQMVECQNQKCSAYFPYFKRGNQVKKYCSNKCKDEVNNTKRKHENELATK